MKLVPYGANGDVPAMVAALQVRGLSESRVLQLLVSERLRNVRNVWWRAACPGPLEPVHLRLSDWTAAVAPQPLLLLLLLLLNCY